MTTAGVWLDGYHLSCFDLHGSTVSLFQYRQQHQQADFVQGGGEAMATYLRHISPPRFPCIFTRVSGPLLHRQLKLTLDDFQLASTQPSQTSLATLPPTSRHFRGSALTWPLQILPSSKRKRRRSLCLRRSAFAGHSHRSSA